MKMFLLAKIPSRAAIPVPEECQVQHGQRESTRPRQRWLSFTSLAHALMQYVCILAEDDTELGTCLSQQDQPSPLLYHAKPLVIHRTRMGVSDF